MQAPTGNNGMTTRNTVAVGLLSLQLCLTAGCADQTPPAEDRATGSPAEAGPATDPLPASSGAARISVSEGTNLAFDLSPDGRTLALSLQGVLFTVPVYGGEAQAISDYRLDARSPVWSADGQEILFQGYTTGDWDLWSVSRTGGEPTALTSGPFDDREPAVATDGRVAFASDRDGNYDIFLLEPGDSHPIALTRTPEDEAWPAWSPDGRRLAFAALPTGGGSELRVVDVATGDARVVVREAGRINGIAWHPDNTDLIYQYLEPGATELRRISLAGGEPVRLSRPDDDVFPFPVDFHGDELLYAANGRIFRQSGVGQRTDIPFQATFELHRDAYEHRRRDHDTDEPRRALGITRPSPSPDAREVTFSALGDIWLWNPESDALTNLSDSPYAERGPVFAPDGHRIAYVSDRPLPDSDAPPGSTALWIFDRRTNRHQPLPFAGYGITAPAWSPEGDTIAVFRALPANPLAAQLMLVDLNTRTATPLHRPMPAQPLSFSADGSVVATSELLPYSRRFREGVYGLTVIPRDGSAPHRIEPLAHRSILDAALSPRDRFMTYLQEGQLWRVQLTESFQAHGSPEPLTNQLTDSPAWAANGRHLVFLRGNTLLRLDTRSGATEDITPAITWKPDHPVRRWTLKVGRLFDGTGDGYLEDVLITVDGHRIESIVPDSTVSAADVDHSGLTAIPGLFEMHAHMGELSEAQGRAWLAWGVTSVRDPGAHPYTAKERQEYWDSGRAPGPRTHITGYLVDGNRVYYPIAEGIGSDIHLERALERTEKLELDFIKTYVRLPDRRQARVIEFAHGLGIPVASHELFPAVALGADQVEHIGGTSRRGYAPKVSALGSSYADVIALLTASGMAITPTTVLPGYSVIAEEAGDLFESPQFRAFYGTAGREAAARLADRFGGAARETVRRNGKFLRDLDKAGALIVAGTDAPFVPYGAGLHAELRLYQKAGLTPARILRAATRDAARATAVDHDLGTLEAGKVADLVLVNGDPLADIADLDNVVLTIRNGRVWTLSQLLEGPGVQE